MAQIQLDEISVGEQLLRTSLDQLQAEFDRLPATNGKKAPAWVNKDRLREDF